MADILPYEKENFIDTGGVLRFFDSGAKLSAANLAILMIIVSDNVATNILIDYLGLDAINEYIAFLGFGKAITDTSHSPLAPR